MSHRELRLNSRRLLIATAIAVAIHAGLFFLIPLVLQLERSRKPEYGGTVLVQLEEPAPAQAVVPAPEPAPVVQPAAQPAAQPAPKPAPKLAPAPKPAPKPVQQAQPVRTTAPAPLPSGPAFKEAGGKTGVVQSPAAAEPLGSAAAAQAVPGPEPTLPGAGVLTGAAAASEPVQRSGVAVAVPAQPTGAAASSGSKPGAAGSTLDLGTLDKALAGSAKSGGTPGKTGAGSGADARDFSVVWDEPDAGKGRDLLSAPRPNLPQWVADQGLTLSVTVSFAVAPDGVVAQARVARSSGYSDVDAAVLEAVRRWRFRAAQTAQTVRGTIAYIIRAR